MRLLPVLLVVLVGLDDGPTHPIVPADPLGADARPVDRERFLQGVAEAEAFRRTLLVPGPDGTTAARRLGETIAVFRAIAAAQLGEGAGLDHFALGPADFEARVRGDGRRVDASIAFGPFAGRWHGLWDKMAVDHDWSAVVFPSPARPGSLPEGLSLTATQSAWVGDGFGWNVVAGTASGGELVLGTVYHVEEGRPDRVRLHRPHVGVDAGPGRLIWVTAGEVFLEEFLPGERPGGERYAITGFRHRVRGTKVEMTGEGFRAVYGRDPERRTPWRSFPTAVAEALPASP